jgi:uncharacterized protein YjhX (UPF0386 family)
VNSRAAASTEPGNLCRQPRFSLHGSTQTHNLASTARDETAKTPTINLLARNGTLFTTTKADLETFARLARRLLTAEAGGNTFDGTKRPKPQRRKPSWRNQLVLSRY